jgi:hypothetical protein
VTKKNEFEVHTGQLVGHSMILEALLGHVVLTSPDQGDQVRQALIAGASAIPSNPNMTEHEKFGCVKTLESALDSMDRVHALLAQKRNH